MEDDDDDAGSAMLALATRDHHDYAKRRRERPRPAPPAPPNPGDLVGGPGPVPIRRGRQLRDPDGGTYMSARSRARRAPLPMKLRALPASFWEQPNLNKGPSPGAMFSALPPLCRGAYDDEPSPPAEGPASLPAGMPAAGGGPACCERTGADADHGGAPAEPQAAEQAAKPVTLTPADTDLLFSLFRSVEAAGTATERRRTRGRPPRRDPETPCRRPGRGPGAAPGTGLRDDDPCLTRGLLPSRQLEGLAALDGALGPLGRVVASTLRGGGSAAGRAAGSGGLSHHGDGLHGHHADGHSLAQILSDLVVKL